MIRFSNLGLACALELAMSTVAKGAASCNPHLERLEQAQVPQAERIYNYLVDNPSPLGLSVGHRIDQIISAVDSHRATGVAVLVSTPFSECVALKLPRADLEKLRGYDILPPPVSQRDPRRRHGKGAQRRRDAPWRCR